MTSDRAAAPAAQQLNAPWLSIVGIGEDGVHGLSESAMKMIADAAVVFGGKRHLHLAQSLIRGEARPWPKPFDPEMRDVLALRGTRVCVLASGDPFFFGAGATLARHLSRDEFQAHPAPSAFSLACARQGWSVHETQFVSVHGRAMERVRPHLHQGVRLVILTSDEDGPAELAALLVREGFEASELTLLEALGGPRERIRHAIAGSFALDNIDALNVVAIQVQAGPKAAIIPYASGRSDDLFEHDGQITKREIRALTLAALSPRYGEILWDVGAGSGSIGIEWMLAHPSLKAIAIEKNGERVERIHRNALRLGVPELEIVYGAAPEALKGLAQPDAIFIGGGGSEPGVLQAAIDALKHGGRLVANAVTLEMEAMLLSRHEWLGGDLLRLSISRAEPIGTMQGWRPAMPLTQWVWTKR
ncbi:precorrin-6y C5,15-methyltransferase (decarboxylating) subunit CbiE [Limoniibacter endophyticus]|uniref:Precorrin-6Y methyltransferase n=1 Tax=Limoniibacter endophyticus TaxID=1565040 RepID=A0A8J3DJH8_9HYPH|nr:precorrin-6y C5,15-methyltransferase (decarboxylating) subunit CbiE [Limoniibacter endophyticus]GHC78464.1 precorrin-6Y methyltransferase [Limoniibacter endophyticus]